MHRTFSTQRNMNGLKMIQNGQLTQVYIIYIYIYRNLLNFHQQKYKFLKCLISKIFVFTSPIVYKPQLCKQFSYE